MPKKKNADKPTADGFDIKRYTATKEDTAKGVTRTSAAKKAKSAILKEINTPNNKNKKKY